MRTQPPIPRNYDPPPPLDFDAYTSSSISHHSGPSTNNIDVTINKTRSHFVFQASSTPERPTTTTQLYTPPQNNTDPNITAILNINTTHTNLPSNTVTSRTVYRPSIPTISINPLQYSLTSTKIPSTQIFVNPLVHNNQTTTQTTTIRDNNVSQ